MTAQAGEVLYIKKKKYAMFTEPLNSYFALAKIDPGFEMPHTACWRGYIGTWRITGNRLFLVGLEGYQADGGHADVRAIFPDTEGPVLAGWYTGELRCPLGEMLHYVHMGYGSTYEKDLLIEISSGYVKKIRTRKNAVPAPEPFGSALDVKPLIDQLDLPPFPVPAPTMQQKKEVLDRLKELCRKSGIRWL